jgi:hypothetical protein
VNWGPADYPLSGGPTDEAIEEVAPIPEPHEDMILRRPIPVDMKNQCTCQFGDHEGNGCSNERMDESSLCTPCLFGCAP